MQKKGKYDELLHLRNFKLKFIIDVKLMKIWQH